MESHIIQKIIIILGNIVICFGIIYMKRRIDWWKKECEHLNELIQEIQESNLNHQKQIDAKSEFILFAANEFEKNGYDHYSKGGFEIHEHFWTDSEGLSIKQLSFTSKHPNVKVILATDYTKLKQLLNKSLNVDDKILDS